MSSLRQELLGLGTLPSMRMLLPAGWRSVALTDDGMQELTDRLRDVFMRAHRPDLDVALTASISRWVRELRAQGGRYAVLPIDLPQEGALPMSLTVSVISEMGEAPLEDWVVAKIRSGTTRFLDEERTVLAWFASESGRGEAEGVTTDAHSYLIPIPGTRRRQAVLLVGMHLVPADMGPEAPRKEAAQVLFDTIALALDWAPPTPDAHPR